MLYQLKHNLLIIVLLALLGSLWGVGETIYEIRVEGTQNIADELVTSAMSLKVGDPVQAESISRSIKNLYRMGVFSDIQIETEPYRTGVNLIVKVAENPVVSSVTYQGFKVIKKDKLEELIGLRIGSYWSGSMKAQVISKLKAEYASKGFGNAQIEILEQALPKNQVALTLHVIEGNRVTLKEITFIGNENFEDKELIRRMKTKPSSFLRSGRFEQEKFAVDLVSLADFYKKNGFIDVAIGPYELQQVSDRHHELVITINEGTKYLFGEITVSGNENFSSEKILESFNFKEGDTFDQEKFDKQMARVYSLYFDEGYIYTDIRNEFDKTGETLNINMTIVENTRAQIRQIHITGNRRTNEKVIRRQLEIAPGDFYRQSQVIRSQQNIYNLGFIEPDIRLDYERINANGDIDLQIDITDKPSGVANGGVGYNSQDKFVGQLSLSQNNLFGNNWSSGITWDFGGRTQNFELSFTNPNLYDSDVLLGTNLYYTKKNWSSFYYEIYTRGAAIRLGQTIPWVDRSRASIGYSFYSKKYNITNRSSIFADSLANATLIELDKLDWRYTSAVNFTLSRDTRDNIFFPTKGSQITLYSEVAGGPFMGDFDYFKQIAQVNWYAEAWKKLTFRTKWRFSYITPYGDSKDAPPDEKFYLGGTGADGIRGYPDRSIGPAGGGTRAIIFSTELGYPIAGDQVIGVTFFDAGDSYNHLRDFNFMKFKKGLGVGVRIRSPFGLIGFDYAYSVADRSWEPHLQFGTTF
ncbi:MAG: outer membrane protein assembly factor BamA [Candidatus Cloacimonetes bacterium]|jgi:outer membrane protein insertion porin family|nr:outer membrane protein assembly factor BamA [Candidatus Cloacimonadota bacterium]MDY0326215.1 outer membrane protein assembly factor BamA [Candidatus Cloacimonadaceae bacterium]